MFVVMISPECAPVAKVGGLADVVQGLSWELAIRGNDVEIILPKYDCMRYDHIWGLTKIYEGLWVPHHNHAICCDVYFGFVHGLRCFFIDPHGHQNFFRRGIFYGHGDDDQRFAFFCRAAMEFMLKTGKNPDIIHCHDWQTGLVPVLLYEVYADAGMTRPRVCYTLHNLQHQGRTGQAVLRQAGLNPAALMTPDRLLDRHRAVNLMQGGIVYSNFITTVSPRYMHEIRYSELGHGMQDVLNAHVGKLGGVLNGVDYNFWNPEVDPLIEQQYGIETINRKYRNKAALRDRLLLRDEYMPIAAVVSRLDHQKGVELIRHGIFYCIANGCQFVLLGVGASAMINEDFWELKRRLNDNADCHLEIGYNEELAHMIYAGADMVLVPSAFEPCGLTQLIAMKYGTVPVVRETGGLADTVFDADHALVPFDRRTGYTFEHYDVAGLESALRRAIGMWYSYPQHFQELMVNGMRADYSWNHSGQDYLNIYHHIKQP